MAVNFETSDAAYVATTAGAIYTNASGETSFVKSIYLHNTNSSAENIKLYVVPDSAGSVGTAGTGNLFLNISLASNDTYLLELPGPGIVLKGTNDTIQASTDTSSKVTVWVGVRIDT